MFDSFSSGLNSKIYRLGLFIIFSSLAFGITAHDALHDIRSGSIRLSQVAEGYVELFNGGTSSVDVSDHWITNGFQTDQVGKLSIACGAYQLEPQMSLVVDLTILIPQEIGELALFSSPEFTTQTMADYVNWGFSNFNSANLEMAIANNIWRSQESSPSLKNGYALFWDMGGRYAESWNLENQRKCEVEEIVNDRCQEIRAGKLLGDPLEICKANIFDLKRGIRNLSIVDAQSNFDLWVITDHQENVLLQSTDKEILPIQSLEAGDYKVYHLVFDEAPSLGDNSNLSKINSECIKASNAVELSITENERSVVNQDTILLCVNDGENDSLTFELLGVTNRNITWVITNERNIVLATPPDITSVNFEGTGGGILYLWAIQNTSTSTNTNLTRDIFNIWNCQDISGPVTINRLVNEACYQICEVIAGEIETQNVAREFDVCTNDNVSDEINIIKQESSDSSVILVTNADDIILSTLEFATIDLEGTGTGIIHLYNAAFIPDVVEISPGMSILDLGECTDLSEPITINRTRCDNECPEILNLKDEKLSETQTLISWSGSPKADDYLVNIFIGQDIGRAIKFETKTEQLIFRPEPEVSYGVRVQAICENEVYSEISRILSITNDR